jgi:transposase InsO family protein
MPLATPMGPPIARVMGPGDGPTTEAIFAITSQWCEASRRPEGPEALVVELRDGPGATPRGRRSGHRSRRRRPLDERDFETRAEANAAIGDYIDAFYNVSRPHSTIGYVSPIEFEFEVAIERRSSVEDCPR